MLPLRRWWLALGVAFLSGCGSTENRTLPLRLEARASGQVIELTQSLNDVASAAGVALLRQDLSLRDSVVGDVADVAEATDGSIYVLNRRDLFVAELASDGTVRRRLSRSGEGPGELNMPYAMDLMGDQVVVLQQLPPGNLISLLARSGQKLAGYGPTIAGDWTTMSMRGPNVFLDFPTQGGGLEDLTRRLVVLNDSVLTIGIRNPVDFGTTEGATAADGDTLRVVAFRMGDALPVDTVVSLPEAPIYFTSQGSEGNPPRTGERVFNARPLFAAGSGWYGYGSGADASFTVVSGGGRDTVRITWPVDTSTVTEDDKLAAAHWTSVYVERSSTYAQERLKGLTRSERRKIERLYLGYLQFAEKVPQIVSVLGSGDCLWLSGYRPRDFLDGTSATWVGINLRERKVAGVFRIPRSDVRVRTISSRGFLSKEFNEDDDAVLTRYAFASPVSC